MNMKRGKVEAHVSGQAAGRMQQHRGIQAAGKAHGDGGAGPDVAGKAGGERLRDRLSGWLVP